MVTDTACKNYAMLPERQTPSAGTNPQLVADWQRTLLADLVFYRPGQAVTAHRVRR